MSLHRLSNQYVVIVGGSSGIGLATGTAAKQLGAEVTLIGLMTSETITGEVLHVDSGHCLV